ncbi:four-domain proteases inhibitor-like [Xenia sp. Carnegie-2017]|uniref:four-domain proteases inhibitor-like n=1 Tax=Xenia sp. Carnegie-2017 TaxID=2897299 RepID=UPI001F040341|nr:four-domain proteases inhibitor-like [Xenia sp. Carnegie-2017]XP_046844814.1 four-domain proteases inhibitor-like [Xenia sp. Carnegie-2017]
MASKILRAVLVFLTIFLTTTESCQPCNKKACNLQVSKCKDGVVKDKCKCCDVCGKKGEACGGIFQQHGKCSEGLKCIKRRPKSVRVVGENDIFSGICEREQCELKICGFNQRCLVKGGKPQCACPKNCKNRYAPVCGETNGQHYWNKCFLRKDECRRQERIGYIKGPCKSCHENGKSYKFGETITRKNSCEKCVCKHGIWKCEHDHMCQSEQEFPQFCDVHSKNCPEGLYCQAPQYNPVVNIGIGLCIPLDEERASEATTETSRNNECPKLKCEVCPHGYIKDQQGCQTCDCIQDKKAKNICEHSKHPGPCMANQKRFYYNSKKGRCIEFTYGGCLSNGNNFASKKKCERRCMKSTSKH